MVENWSRLHYFRNSKVLKSGLFRFVINFEELGKGRVGELELLELCIGHGLVVAVFLVSGEEVALRDLPLVRL